MNTIPTYPEFNHHPPDLNEAWPAMREILLPKAMAELPQNPHEATEQRLKELTTLAEDFQPAPDEVYDALMWAQLIDWQRAALLKIRFNNNSHPQPLRLGRFFDVTLDNKTFTQAHRAAYLQLFLNQQDIALSQATSPIDWINDATVDQINTAYARFTDDDFPPKAIIIATSVVESLFNNESATATAICAAHGLTKAQYQKAQQLKEIPYDITPEELFIAAKSPAITQTTLVDWLASRRQTQPRTTRLPLLGNERALKSLYKKTFSSSLSNERIEDFYEEQNSLDYSHIALDNQGKPAGFTMAYTRKSLVREDQIALYVAWMGVLPQAANLQLAKQMLLDTLDTCSGRGLAAVECKMRKSTAYRMVTSPYMQKAAASLGYVVQDHGEVFVSSNNEAHYLVRIEKGL